MRPVVRVTAEWALWGKPPDARDDYEVLECSRGKLGRDEFSEIMTRYAPGTPTELPQVTIGWVGGLDDVHLGLAIHEWSGQQDGLGRPIANIRYFCVPYRQAAAGPVSYEALYDAFAGRALPVDGPLTVDVPVLDLQAIARRADMAAANAAALLLAGEQVCVVRGESVPMRDRLRFLDVVAALLPYGLRARQTASTWTDSSARHRIKLSFAKHAMDGAHSVTWGARDAVASHLDIAGRYMELLPEFSAEELVGRLAKSTEALSFKDAWQATLTLLGDSSATAPVPAHRVSSVSSEVGDMLKGCADHLEHGRYEELGTLLMELHGVAVGRDFTDDGRDRHQEIIRRGRLLSDLPGERRNACYKVILTVGYGPVLTAEDIGRIREDAGALTGALVKVMLDMPRTPGAALKLALCLDDERKAHVLQSLQTGQLVKEAARKPFDPPIVRTVFEELVARGGSGAEDSGIAPALREHDYLSAAIENVYPNDGETRFDCLRKLLIAAYGPALERGAFKEVIGHPFRSSATLLAAVVSLYGPGARDVLMRDVFFEFLGRAQLKPKILNGVLNTLSVSSAAAGPRAPRPPLIRRVRLRARERGRENTWQGRPQPPGSGRRPGESLFPFWTCVCLVVPGVVLVAAFIWFWCRL